MIHTNRIVTVGEQESIIDRPIVLYRGDREVEIEFTLVGNEFTFSEEGNVIKSVNASHGQLVLNTPSGEHMFSELAECHEGKVVFVVTKEMIDEFIEMGFYSFQIRLYDSAEMKSRVTIPPVLSGFDIRNPIAAEDETNVVDQGVVDYARIFKDQSNEELPTFDWQGNYNKTEWVHHDVITENKMNKIEDALYSINANGKESDVVMLNTLDKVKKDADKYVKEHIAEVEADVDEFERNLNNDVQKFKMDANAAMTAHKNEVSEEIESFNSQLEHKANKSEVNTLESQINSFVLEQSNGMSDTGSLELRQMRTNLLGANYDVVNSRINTIEKASMFKKNIKGELIKGFYIKDTFENTPSFESKIFDISNCECIELYINEVKFYNRYTFLDSQNNIISFMQSDTSSYVEEIIVVPKNADKLVVSTSASNIKDVHVLGYTSIATDLKEKIDIINNTTISTISLKKLKHEQGGWHHDKNCFEVNFKDYNYLLYDVERINSVYIKAVFGQYSDLYVLFDKELNILERNNISNPITGTIYEGNIDVSSAYYLGITTPKNEVNNIVLTSDCNTMVNIINSPWKGKKIVWFGTSIPAGGYSGLTSTLQYPKLVGELLGAKVVNEAIGESAIHCKRPWAITDNNPLGFSNNWSVVSRCLSNSLDDMEWVIENYNNREIFNWNAVDTLTDSQKEAIRDCSWERKLKRHLGENRADLYVFDHGHNDEISDSQERYYTDEIYGGKYNLYTYRGAMNFLINKIKEDNPFARIVMIGEYENQKQPKISEYQSIVANDWSIPLYKQWEQLGWSQNTVKTTGFWENGYWTPNGGPERYTTYLDLWLPDKIHPHSDLSGKAIRFVAENIANWLKTIS